MKKLATMAISIGLIGTMVAGGSLAYLQDSDSDVNVMTLGSVKIEQHEFERAVDANGNYTTIDVDGAKSYELKEFTQGKPLYPFVGAVDNGYDSIPVRLAQLGHNSRGSMEVFPAANVQDKFVVVENTGKSDAYVRTIVAFEAGSVVEEDWYKLVSYSSHFTWEETQDWFVTEINGNNYYVVEFVYNGYQDVQHPNGVLKPGDYTYNNLAQVYMFDKATNEDVAALDGNKNGTFDILVLSQAVQTAGFTDATTALTAGFGAFNEKNVKAWFAGENAPVIPVAVSNADELTNALSSGKAVVLTNDITLENPVAIDATANINLNGKTLMTKGLELKAGGAIQDGTVESAGNTYLTPHLKVSGGEFTMDNVTVDVKHHLNANVNWAEATGMEVVNATAVLNNCDIKIHNETFAKWVYSYGISLNTAELTMNGGSITASCVAGTAANGPTNPNAISTMGACTATLNDVEVTADYYVTTVNGHATINTTDKTITSANIVDNRGGSHTLNYID